VNDATSGLDTLENSLMADIASAADEPAIEAVRIAAFGKKGTVSEMLKTLGAMTAEERQIKGPVINGLKNRVTEALTARKAELKDVAIAARLAAEKVDVTLPVRQSPAERGRIHPRSSAISASRSPKVPISRPTITISPR
jgi:phenylalanyl-tRNA synthetase alpha chain